MSSVIKIAINARGIGTVEVDGQELRCVQAVNIRCRGGRMPRVFLQLVGRVEIQVEASAINADLLGIPLTIVQGEPRRP